MPVTADDVVHENSGASSAAGTSIPVALAGADSTTAGNTVIVYISGLVSGMTLPPGFVAGPTVSSVGQGIGVWYKPNVAAGETAWTFTATSAFSFCWYVREMSSLDPASPLDIGATNAATAALTSGATKSSGSAGPAAGLATVQIAAWAVDVPSGVTPGTWGSYTNFAERAAQVSSGAGIVNFGLAVADAYTDASVGPFDSTATYTGATTTHGYGLIAVFRAADSAILTPLQYHTGFEYGTHNGINGGSTGAPTLASAIGGTVGVNVIVQGASARNGSYGLRIVASASAAFVPWNAAASATAFLPGSQGALVAGFSVKPVSGSGVLVLAEVQSAAGTTAQLVYDATTSKLGWRWGSGGTPAYQAGTTSAGSWAWVTARVSGLNAATWSLAWQCEESGVLVDQTGPTDLAGQTASVLAIFRLGANVSQTMTADYDDVCLTTQYPVYPLGIHKVLGLLPDTAATPAVTGTIGNLALLTNNVTGAALTSGALATARDSLRVVPPTVAATRDGVGQVTTDTATYISLPMETYTPSGSEVVSAVRMLACVVSTTGAGAGSLGVNGHDGTSSVALVGTGFTWTPGSSTTPSSTIPPWVTAQWNPSGGWTTAKLAAAALEVGRSGDATPDMFVAETLMLEAAIGPVRTARLGDIEGGTFAVDVRLNPNSAAYVSLLVTVPADRGMAWNYSVAGTPQNPAPVAAGSGPVEVVTGASAYGEITDVQLYPDASPDQPG